MAIHWKIPFKSLRSGTVYTVNIYDDSYTGTAVVLKGGAQPFTTQEDTANDFFVPVRTQSGYLRIVDDGLDANGNAWNWKTIIPETDTSRPVTLTNASNVVVWMGFMQAQDFGNVLYGNPQEREFPVQCPLTVTECTDINYQQTAIQNFAYLLKQIIDSIPSTCRPSNVYLQGGTDAQAWLLKCIDWQNFVNKNADDSLSARFNMYQCLEDMCRFWGWTARVHGVDMFLSCADEGSSWLKLTYAQLTTMAGGSSAGTTQTFSTISMSGDIFASTHNDDYLQRGCRKATVTGNGNTANEDVLFAFPASVEKTMISGGNYRDGDVLYTQDITSFSSALMTGSCVSGKATFNKMLVGSDGSFGTQSPTSRQEYDVIKIKDDYSGTALASMETVYQHSFYDNTVPNGGFDYGGLYMNFDIFRNGERYEDYDSGGVGRYHIKVRVGIGTSRANALWYNGSTWSSTASDITIRVGDEKAPSNMLSINTNHANMKGILFVDFMGSNDIPAINGKRRFEIVNFKMEFQRRVYSWLFNTETRADTREYTATNQNKMVDEMGVDCAFASENDLQFGYGVILNPDGTHMTGYNYNGSSTATHPEQHLADRIVNYWETSKRRLQVELRLNTITEPTPQNKVTIDSSTMYPISISHEWRDDVLILTLLEL